MSQAKTNTEEETMAPKAPSENDSKDKSTTQPAAVEEIAEDDLREIESVSNNLDSLNSALDFIEQRNDNIRAQLLELLSSSREIRQSIREENNKNGPIPSSDPIESGEDDHKMQ